MEASTSPFREIPHQGEPAVDPRRTYRATVNLGVVQGLGAIPGVSLAAEPRLLGASEYQAVRDWLIRLRHVLYFPQGRLVDVGVKG